MDSNYLSIVLLLFIGSNELAAASLSSDRFTCNQIINCSCTDAFSDFEIECPGFNQSISIRMAPKMNVEIECKEMSEHVYQKLPVMTLGDIKTVRIRRCPLPVGGSSIQRILDRLGMKRLRSLAFNNYFMDSKRLVREHLRGLDELERLMLGGLTELPEDVFTDVQNLTWLELKSNNIELPASIFQPLKKLELLDLGYNSLRTLEPGLFREQKKLRVLNLWGNDLQNLSRESFQGLQTIDDLDLSANKMLALPDNIFDLLPNLTRIHLSANNFTELPADLFVNNKKLNIFKIVNNRVNLETLPDGMLANLTQLKEVLIIQCGLSTMPADLFEGSEDVGNIELAYNRLKSLPVDIFASQKNLETLDLSNNELMELEDRTFDSLTKLETLKLDNNQIGVISE